MVENRLMRRKHLLSAMLLMLVIFSSGCIVPEMDLTDEAQLSDRETAPATQEPTSRAATIDAINTLLSSPGATATSRPTLTNTVTPTATEEPTRTPTLLPSPTSTPSPVPSATALPTDTAVPTAPPTSTPAPTATPTTPAPSGSSSAVPINYFDNNPDWEALVACAANFGNEIIVSPDEFRNVAGPFERYENGQIYFQGYAEPVQLNLSSSAGIRYVTKGDPLFRYEPAYFGQLPWTAETVVSALQQGDWIIVGGQSGYLGVACNAYQP